MNSFLRAIGFKQYKNKTEFRDIMTTASLFPDSMNYIDDDEIGKIYEFVHLYNNCFGIKFYGTEEGEDYIIDSYIPFVDSNDFFIPLDLCIEKRYNGFSFIASCEDLRVGVSIIFHLVNPMDYINILYEEKTISKYLVAFSALSLNGTVLLPVSKSPGDARRKKENMYRRAKLIAAARKGDESAMESLTFEDMDTIAKLSKRIKKEDVFTIVESSFMPYGLESDLYTIIADILDFTLTKNSFTNEEVYILKLSYNGIIITAAINKNDIVGEPLVGRRFKGTIWLQGKIKVEM